MKRFANILKKLSLYDAEREVTKGGPRHSAERIQEIRHNLEQIIEEDGEDKKHRKEYDHKKEHKHKNEWSDENDHSHWTY